MGLLRLLGARRAVLLHHGYCGSQGSSLGSAAVGLQGLRWWQKFGYEREQNKQSRGAGWTRRRRGGGGEHATPSPAGARVLAKNQWESRATTDSWSEVWQKTVSPAEERCVCQASLSVGLARPRQLQGCPRRAELPL